MDIVKTEKIVFTKEEYNAWIMVYSMVREIKAYSETTELQESAEIISDLMDTIDNYTTADFSK